MSKPTREQLEKVYEAARKIVVPDVSVSYGDGITGHHMVFVDADKHKALSAAVRAAEQRWTVVREELTTWLCLDGERLWYASDVRGMRAILERIARLLNEDEEKGAGR